MPSALSSQSSVKHDASAGDDTERLSKGEEDPQMSLFHQVSEWLQHEKVRRKNRKARRAAAAASGAAELARESEDYSPDEAP